MAILCGFPRPYLCSQSAYVHVIPRCNSGYTFKPLLKAEVSRIPVSSATSPPCLSKSERKVCPPCPPLPEDVGRNELCGLCECSVLFLLAICWAHSSRSRVSVEWCSGSAGHWGLTAVLAPWSRNHFRRDCALRYSKGHYLTSLHLAQAGREITSVSSYSFPTSFSVFLSTWHGNSCMSSYKGTFVEAWHWGALLPSTHPFSRDHTRGPGGMGEIDVSGPSATFQPYIPAEAEVHTGRRLGLS